MLNKAKKRKGLKDSKFIKADIRKLNLKKKFDIILSFFSFGSSSYFNEEEIKGILKVADKHLKKNGIFAVLGHTPIFKFEKKFKKLEGGIYDISKTKEFYSDYFIGRKT
jgi:cyclopropane fatty-acyl-phospholipid synthase-like methyltransferase